MLWILFGTVGAGAADRRRQCGESVSGSRGIASAGSGGAGGTRRRPMAFGADVSRRESGAGARWRSGRLAAWPGRRFACSWRSGRSTCRVSTRFGLTERCWHLRVALSVAPGWCWARCRCCISAGRSFAGIAPRRRSRQYGDARAASRSQSVDRRAGGDGAAAARGIRSHAAKRSAAVRRRPGHQDRRCACGWRQPGPAIRSRAGGRVLSAGARRGSTTSRRDRQGSCEQPPHWGHQHAWWQLRDRIAATTGHGDSGGHDVHGRHARAISRHSACRCWPVAPRSGSTPSASHT